MALRLMLVSLVASLGLDLPEGREVTGWLRSGQCWLSERWESVEDWMGAPVPESELAGDEEAVEAGDSIAGVVSVEPAVGSEAAPGDSPSIEIVETGEDRPEVEDAAFETVVGAMASEFAVAEGRGEEVLPALGDVAYELNRISDGVDDGWMIDEGEPESRPMEVAEGSVEVAPEPEVEPRSERLGTAIRLTAQALEAWMSVLSQSGPIRVTGR